jgi:hypothetical protein
VRGQPSTSARCGEGQRPGPALTLPQTMVGLLQIGVPWAAVANAGFVPTRIAVGHGGVMCQARSEQPLETSFISAATCLSCDWLVMRDRLRQRRPDVYGR